MTVETPFTTHEDAQSAYYGDGGGGDGSDGSDGTDDTGTGDGWGQPTEVATLDGGWVLLSQAQVDGSRTRWFVAGGPQGGYLNESGGTVTPDTNETLSDMPSFGTEEDARAAHASWLDENGTEGDDGEEGDESGEWGDWTEVQAVDPWHLFSREHTTEDRVQLLLAGVNEAGENVYLHPGGKVKSEQHIYESAQAVNDALDAYTQREADGDVPDDRRPTGSKPSKGDVEGDTDDGPGGVAGVVSGAINAASENPFAVAGVAGAGLLAYRYRGEL